jgi:Cys-tRNA(Pro)/Cys-tRNA(Cys) deacylase
VRKTLAARELDRAGVSYELREFEAGEFSAEEVARELEIPLSQVFKTLVVRGNRTGILLACIPGDRELNLKDLARISGNKRVEMVRKAEVQKITGYLPGGCSPLAGKKKHPLFVDREAEQLPSISISAGLRGLQILMAGPDLIRLTGAVCAEISH